MVKKIIFGEEARKQLMNGIDTAVNAIKITLGPQGKNVVLSKGYSVEIVNDGVTIAEEIELEEGFEKVGAELVKEVAQKTQSKVGDGTTTSSLLLQSIVKQGLKNISSGANSIQIKKGIEKAVENVVEFLNNKKIMVDSDEKIQQVATISANNDEVIGKLIFDAMKKVGNEGIITVEESNSIETKLKVVEGMELNEGFESPYMITDQEKMESVLESPLVLIYDGNINNVQDFVPVIEKSMQESRPLLIISEGLSQEVLATLILNILRGTIKCCAIKSPGFGEEKKQILEDIAILTGGEVISSEKGIKISDAVNYLGTTEKVRCAKDKTLIIGGQGNNENIEKRVRSIELQIKNESSDYEKDNLRKRLGKLMGGVAVIEVGAATETELKEKKLRIDDALNATRAAVEEGYVVGGGIALLNASKSLSNFKLQEDENIGVDIIRRSLEEPVIQLVENSGKNGFVYVEKIKEMNDENQGYDARAGEIVDLIERGVIDPVKVVRVALQGAASVASLILTSDAIISEVGDKKEKDSMPDLSSI